MRKTVIFSLVTSIVMSMCAGVLAAEETYTEGDFVYSAATGKIVGWAGDGYEVAIPANSVISGNLTCHSKGLFSQKTKEYIPIKKLTVSEGVKIEGTISIFDCDSLQEVEFYNTAGQITKLSMDFEDNKKLEKLRLPNGLTEISSEMCKDCTGLKSVYLPDSVTRIKSRAFMNCNALESIDLPENLETIEDEAFYGCKSLKSVRLPNKADNIGKDAFRRCDIEQWYIPASVDYTKLYMSKNTKEIEFEKEPERTVEFYQYFWDTEWMQKNIIQQIKEDFFEIDGYLIKYLGKEKEITIPDNIKIIGERAFTEAKAEKINTNKVKKIEYCAFCNNQSIKEVVFAPSMERIEDSAFSGCHNLTNISFEGDCVLEDCAFYYCYNLKDEGITTKGKLTYEISSKNSWDYGDYTDPFAFTDTTYAIERYCADTNGSETSATAKPTEKPTATPTEKPSEKPTATPTEKPTETPTEKVSERPSESPTAEPEKNIITVILDKDKITVKADEEEIRFTDAYPYIDENGRTQIPIRAVGEALKCDVNWNESDRTVTLTRNGTEVIITIDSSEIKINGKMTVMDTKAKIIGDRTYIPLRFAAEALGMTVNWKTE